MHEVTSSQKEIQYFGIDLMEILWHDYFPPDKVFYTIWIDTFQHKQNKLKLKTNGRSLLHYCHLNEKF